MMYVFNVTLTKLQNNYVVLPLWQIEIYKTGQKDLAIAILLQVRNKITISDISVYLLEYIHIGYSHTSLFDSSTFSFDHRLDTLECLLARPSHRFPDKMCRRVEKCLLQSRGVSIGILGNIVLQNEPYGVVHGVVAVVVGLLLRLLNQSPMLRRKHTALTEFNQNSFTSLMLRRCL
jgi:hypothetical protein